MSRISDKDTFLINAEYISNKIKIRLVYYLTLLILVLTFIAVSSYRFSIDLSFEGSISQAPMLNSSNSSQTAADKLIEIQVNQALSDILENYKDIQIELLENNIPMYRCRGEIVQYSSLLNKDKQNISKALIAKTTKEGQIELFPSNLPENCRAEINIFDVRITLNHLLSLITHKNLFSIEINQFS